LIEYPRATPLMQKNKSLLELRLFFILKFTLKKKQINTQDKKRIKRVDTPYSNSECAFLNKGLISN